MWNIERQRVLANKAATSKLRARAVSLCSTCKNSYFLTNLMPLLSENAIMESEQRLILRGYKLFSRPIFP